MEKIKLGTRIVILGSGGSGKSFLAQSLGEILNIPVIHLDKLYWKENWNSPDESEWRNKQSELVQEDSWIIEGNYWRTLNVRLSRANTVIFLDINRWICLSRVLKRWLIFHGKERKDMANGCLEKIDINFLKTIWKFPKKYKPALMKQIEHYSEVMLIIIFNSKQVKDLLCNLKK